MKRTRISGALALTTCSFVACAAFIASAAQTPAQSSSTTQKSSNTVMIEGCVERNPSAASATPGAVGTSGSTNTNFILSDAMKAPGQMSGSSSSSAAIASSYRLDAPDSKLTAHVGHKVEITGTVESNASTSGSSSRTSSSASLAAAPKLKVEDVKMLASTCKP